MPARAPPPRQRQTERPQRPGRPGIGHTPRSLVVRVGDDILVVDLVRGGVLRPKSPKRHFFTEDAAGVRRALTTELDRRPRRLLPGHGGPLDADETRRRLDTVAPSPGRTAASG
ncbi:hypothetical protein JHN63_15800 [Streptomyces sp. MBT65]|uniref:hypothetical protein n=1 Tax=Streptomyces sp. MBT65 TaxID=1488395 RepID=UPI00190A8853|nr:hypothetical protein [Streptomyces sp. MBT65]MBK3575250.1 hypothetical protein [Streptomyces sp. MBT65]